MAGHQNRANLHHAPHRNPGGRQAVVRARRPIDCDDPKSDRPSLVGAALLVRATTRAGHRSQTISLALIGRTRMSEAVSGAVGFEAEYGPTSYASHASAHCAVRTIGGSRCHRL